jgi:hypothetical protein
VTCAMCCCYGLSRHQPTPSRTPPRSCAVSSPSMPSAPRHPIFTLPQAAGKHHPVLSSRTLSRAPRAARRGASSTARRLQPRLRMMAASIGKQAAPLWHTPQLSQIVASIRCGRPPNHFEKLLEETCLNYAYRSSASSGTAA